MKWAEKYLDLAIPRIELFRDRLQWKYGFSLTAHERTIKFLASSKEEALKWYNKMRHQSNVALIHIARNYTLGKVIGKTSRYKIHLATNVGGNTGFTVKSMFKPRLCDDDQVLVYLIYNVRCNSTPSSLPAGSY